MRRMFHARRRVPGTRHVGLGRLLVLTDGRLARGSRVERILVWL